MAKFHGKIGYVKSQETVPGSGNWEEVVTEYVYTGDIIRNSSRLVSGEGLNDNLVMNNQFSILGDWFAYENFGTMRYIEWMNSKWKITNVEVQRPRLIITVGGVYNAPKT